MSDKKIYSAFISSVYESLRDERSLVIDTLLDYKVFPICMEHFTVSSNGKFKDIEDRIDEADIFILILGERYGSTDEYGISWTEREYRYALKTHKQILAIICDELDAMLKLDYESLKPEQKKQVDFCKSISFARTVSNDLTVERIVAQFLSQLDYSRFAGWVRGKPEKISESVLEEWRSNHRAFDLAGTWYHVHLSPDDEKYIRVGTINIRQSFDPDNYQKLYLDGYNYSVINYDKEQGKIVENRLKSTHWTGDYTVDRQGITFGIFLSKREFTGRFKNQDIERGIRRGIHDFRIDVSVNKRVEEFLGEFHDEAPSPKVGSIYVFRSAEARFKFLLDNCGYLFNG